MKNKWARLVTMLLILIAAICLFVWLRTEGEISDFGLNAFTETLGIIVTVLIVEQLIRRQEQTRLLPQQAAAYEDVRLLSSRVVSFWSDIYRLCVPGPAPKTLGELLSEQSFQKICSYLNMDSGANVIPDRTWWEWFPQVQAEFKKLAETILERHNTILDPEAYSAVHKLITAMRDPDTILASRQAGEYFGFQKPKVLGWYWSPGGDYGEQILALVAWCEKKAKILELAGVANILKVISQVYQWESQTAPRCMIDQSELLKQIDTYEKSRKDNKTRKP